MILIISAIEDLSTDYVIDWLNYYKWKYTRLNFTELLNPVSRSKIKFSLDNGVLEIGDTKIDSRLIKSVWLRKIGAFKKSVFYKRAKDDGINSDIIEHIINEYRPFLVAILKNLNKCFWLTNTGSIGINKWWVQKKASECGLSTPQTFIINNKSDLQQLAKSQSYITKALREPLFLSEEDFYYTMYTTEVDETKIDMLPEYFVPSLVQAKIEKEFEIRTFFLEDDFHSMAIFSQNDPQTTIDFRVYNLIKPNRKVPYQLPVSITIKLKELTKSIGLNSGSIDLIKSKSSEYVFLEINPHGQFGMVDM